MIPTPHLATLALCERYRAALRRIEALEMGQSLAAGEMAGEALKEGG